MSLLLCSLIKLRVAGTNHMEQYTVATCILREKKKANSSSNRTFFPHLIFHFLFILSRIMDDECTSYLHSAAPLSPSATAAIHSC